MDNNEYYVDLNKRDCKFFARNWRIENIEAFELTFGDHMEVTATKDGFETEEYEHE